MQAESKKTFHFPGISPIEPLMNLTSLYPAKKILAVDDNPVILKALSLVLSREGYQVLTALDGPEAFNITRREQLDLILLDIFFPPDISQSGMTWDAFLIIQWLQRMGMAEGVPILVISSAEPDQFRERCLDAGVQGFFSKPIDMSELLDTIQDIFSRKADAEFAELAAILQHRVDFLEAPLAASVTK